MFLQACTFAGTRTPDAAVDGNPPDTFPRSLGCDELGASVACPPTSYATWRMPNAAALPLPNPAAMQVNGEIAVDRVTGLTWQRGFTPKLTRDEAQAHCDTLALMGFNDWRLPSRIELISLLDHTRTPSLDNQAFADTPTDYFWTSSVVPFAPDQGFSVYFGAGFTAFGKLNGPSAHVRCVRGGVMGVSPHLLVNEAEVIDVHTELHWQRVLQNQEPVTWDAAHAHCVSLRLLGSQRWRLPSAKELQTIVDETQTGLLMDPAAFPRPPGTKFWTAPAFTRTAATAAFYVDFADGTSEEALVNEAMHVRCVR